MLLLLLGHALAGALDGRYTRSSPLEDVRAAQQRSIDAALADLPGMLRPIADRVLAPALNVCGAYELGSAPQLTPPQFTVRCDQNTPIALPTDGVVRTVLVGDEPRPVSARWDGPAAVLTITSDDGARTTRYEPLPDGGLRVRVSVTSSHLASPISWTVDYTRAP